MRKKLFIVLSFCLVIIAITLLQIENPLSNTRHSGVPERLGVPDPANARIIETYGKLPLNFEANEGQTDSEVKFLSRSSGYTLFLTSTEVVMVRRKHGKAGGTKHSAKGVILRMKLEGANALPQVTGMDELPGRSNYFIGNDPAAWRTNVPTYAKVRYENVYSGIDLVYYGNQRQLEYDFVVAPGADPSAIRLGFTGAQRLEIGPQGDLAFQTQGDEARLGEPIMYQVVGGIKQIVDGHYVRKGKTAVGFAVSFYDHNYPLIIDPVLVYSTYLGGSGDDQGFGIVRDSLSNTYVTGTTTSANFPAANAFQPAPGGGLEVFVTRLNAAGDALVYSTYLGGSNDDQGVGIAVDYASGDAYVTGITQSANFPTANAFQSASGGNSDAFITKLNAAGNGLIYSTYLGGNGYDYSYGIAVDSAGNAYVTGAIGSNNFPTTTNAFQTTSSAGIAAFVTKLNTTGNALVYSTYLAGSNGDYGVGIAVDSLFNAYVTGRTFSNDFPTTANSFQPNSIDGRDAFVTKLNIAGSALVYSTYLGGSNPDQGFGIAVDSAFNAYVTGITGSVDFPTANAFQSASGGSSDAFVTKLNAAGNTLVYSTYLGGTRNDQGFGIAVDFAFNAYATGFTGSSNFPTANAIQPAFGGGGGDAFVTELNAAGNALVFSTYLGGSAFDEGRGIAVDGSGLGYVTGTTGSINFPTANAIQPTGGGTTEDAFVAKICTLCTPGKKRRGQLTSQ